MTIIFRAIFFIAASHLSDELEIIIIQFTSKFQISNHIFSITINLVLQRSCLSNIDCYLLGNQRTVISKY